MTKTVTTAEEFRTFQREVASEERKARRKAQADALLATWERQMSAIGVGGYVKEHKFDPGRRWRFDYSWPDLKLAVELDGFGHHRLNRYFGDVEKANAATLLGWRVLHITTAMVKDGTGIKLVERALDLWAGGDGVG